MTQVSLKDVYTEVKRVNMRLESLERALETLMDIVLPEEKISEEEWKEIKEIEEETEKGKSVSLAKRYGRSTGSNEWADTR